ncbi:MAG TPA: methyltransferase domain-containing protein [Candidatus Baltobacteraceae bacterium]|nr:methyltransferase domain-containing protein [Candidatus Baltobacteraceae bacterium]
MPPLSPQDEPSIRPHPLALRVIELLRGRPGATVLDFGTGRGRNAAALRAAGLAVIAIEDARAESPDPLQDAGGRFAAGLSTHGLLHGTPAALAKRLQALAAAIEPGGKLFATFGSARDARCGRGKRIDDMTYAPIGGDENDVPHAFFTREPLEQLLGRHFSVESLTEACVDTVAGTWAHHRQPLDAAVHWFVEATRL